MSLLTTHFLRSLTWKSFLTSPALLPHHPSPFLPTQGNLGFLLIFLCPARVMCGIIGPCSCKELKAAPASKPFCFPPSLPSLQSPTVSTQRWCLTRTNATASLLFPSCDFCPLLLPRHPLSPHTVCPLSITLYLTPPVLLLPPFCAATLSYVHECLGWCSKNIDDAKEMPTPGSY